MLSAVRSHSKDYVSNRRAVTEMEKNDALRRANQEQTENSFVVVMRPTCVYKRFYLVHISSNSISSIRKFHPFQST